MGRAPESPLSMGPERPRYATGQTHRGFEDYVTVSASLLLSSLGKDMFVK